MITITQRNNTEYAVRFPYDAKLVELIKTVPSRRWDPDNKYWSISSDKLGWAIRLFEGAHQQVNVVSNESLGMNATLDATAQIPDVDLSHTHFYIKSGSAPYPHQLDFMRWAIHRQQTGNMRGFILADQPGLGKSIESCNLALYNRTYHNYQHCLILCCVNSSKYHWRNDIELHTDGEYVPYVLGTRKGRNGQESCRGNAEKLADLRNTTMYGKSDGDPLPYFIILNVESIRMREGKKYPIADRIIDLIKSSFLSMVIIDEVHKNVSPSSLQGKQLLRIYQQTEGMAMWLPMTGTPIVNKPTDLYTPLKLIGGHSYTSYYHWCQNYCVYGGYGDHEIIGFKNIPELKDKLQGNMLRRLKHDVLKDLPPKLRVTEYVENTPYQDRLYKTVLGEILASREMILSSLNPLAQLMRLRQVNGSPELVDAAVDPKNPDNYLKQNAKLVRLLELLADIHERGEKVVVFSNWVEPLRTLYRYTAAKYGVCSFTGTMSVEAREANKIKFMTDPAATVLLATVGAGGTAQTFTAANNVIFYDSPWTPADKEQAEDRCHRISTQSTVNIYTIVTANTVDERVERILYAKQGVSDFMVDNKLDLTNNPDLFNYLLS